MSNLSYVYTVHAYNDSLILFVVNVNVKYYLTRLWNICYKNPKKLSLDALSRCRHILTIYVL